MEGARARVGSRVMRLGVLANGDAIAKIAAAGDIAVVVFEANGDAADLARLFGWDGTAAVFRLAPAHRVLFAASGVDEVTERWLTRETALPRALLLSGHGSMLLNGDEKGDWGIEPGQMKREVL